MVNEKIGRFMDAHEVIKEVVKDRVFFDQSDGGGVTFSGGEPLAQADFLKSLLFFGKRTWNSHYCGHLWIRQSVGSQKKLYPTPICFIRSETL